MSSMLRMIQEKGAIGFGELVIADDKEKLSTCELIRFLLLYSRHYN